MKRTFFLSLGMLFACCNPCLSDTEAERHSVVLNQQIEETIETNMVLLGMYEKAREDAIVAVALIGNSISREKREDLHRRMTDLLHLAVDRLNAGQLVLDNISGTEDQIESQLVVAAKMQLKAEQAFLAIRELRRGLEEGLFEKEFLEGL